MPFEIKIKASALKAIRKAEENARARIWTAISALADDPRPTGCVKMSGGDDLWRIRVGDWRIIYQIRDGEMVVLVVRVGNRREVYR